MVEMSLGFQLESTLPVSIHLLRCRQNLMHDDRCV